MNGSTSKRSADRTPDRRDPIIRVSTGAQGEVGSITGRAARVGGSAKRDSKSGTARWRPKGTGLPKGELDREIEVAESRVK